MAPKRQYQGSGKLAFEPDNLNPYCGKRSWALYLYTRAGNSADRTGRRARADKTPGARTEKAGDTEGKEGGTMTQEERQERIKQKAFNFSRNYGRSGKITIEKDNMPKGFNWFLNDLAKRQGLDGLIKPDPFCPRGTFYIMNPSDMPEKVLAAIMAAHRIKKKEQAWKWDGARWVRVRGV